MKKKGREWGEEPRDMEGYRDNWRTEKVVASSIFHL